MDTETTIRAYQSGHKSGTSNAILYKFLADAQRRLRQLETRVTEADDPEDAAYAAGLADAYRARVAELTPPDHCPHGNPEHDFCPICDDTPDSPYTNVEVVRDHLSCGDHRRIYATLPTTISGIPDSYRFLIGSVVECMYTPGQWMCYVSRVRVNCAWATVTNGPDVELPYDEAIAYVLNTHLAYLRETGLAYDRWGQLRERQEVTA